MWVQPVVVISALIVFVVGFGILRRRFEQRFIWKVPPTHMKARPLPKPIYTDERATKNPNRPYDWEVECPDWK